MIFNSFSDCLIRQAIIFIFCLSMWFLVSSSCTIIRISRVILSHVCLWRMALSICPRHRLHRSQLKTSVGNLRTFIVSLSWDPFTASHSFTCYSCFFLCVVQLIYYLSISFFHQRKPVDLESWNDVQTVQFMMKMRDKLGFLQILRDAGINAIFVARILL